MDLIYVIISGKDITEYPERRCALALYPVWILDLFSPKVEMKHCLPGSKDVIPSILRMLNGTKCTFSVMHQKLLAF